MREVALSYERGTRFLMSEVRRWFGSHHDKPYPSRSQKEDIVRITVEINEPICVCQVPVCV